MSTEETNARLLAEWLAAPAGTPPPEGLEDEVVAAVYAMRPDRAPAARVSMDDIFAAVTTGPFSAAASTAPSTTPPEAEFPAGASGRTQGGQRRAAGPARGESGVVERPPKRRPSRWWMAPAVGLSLAAAAALMLVIPVAGHYLSPSEGKMAEEAARSVAVSAAPSPAAPAAPAAPTGGAPEAAPRVDAPDATAELQSVAPAAAPALAGAKTGASDGWIPEMGDGQGAVAQGGEQAKDDLSRLGYLDDRKEEAAKKPAALEPPPPAEAPAPRPAATAAPAPKVAASPPPVSAPAPAAKPAPEPAGGIAEMESSRERVTEKKSAMDEDYGDADEAPLAKAQSAPAKAQDKAKVATKSSAKPAPTPSRSAGPGGATGAPAPTMSSGTKAVADVEMDDEAQEESAVNPRDAAVPHDYAASWYSSRGDIAPAYAAADALRAAGKTEEAIKAWTALISNPDPNVGQDAAYRAASLLRSNPSRGLSLIAQGLARSSANTVYRSNLLLLKGDLLKGQGDSAGAAAAWAEGAKLNAAR